MKRAARDAVSLSTGYLISDPDGARSRLDSMESIDSFGTAVVRTGDEKQMVNLGCQSAKDDRPEELDEEVRNACRQEDDRTVEHSSCT